MSFALRDRPDTVTARAVDHARAALLEEVSPGEIGSYLGGTADGERVVTHAFVCLRRGYPGWQWMVTLARAYRVRTVTVVEITLLPGEEAILAPSWVPYRDRVRPGDLSPGDLLPVADDDPRLVPAYSFGDDPLDADAKAQIRDVSSTLGLGRVRTLSPEGWGAAAQRWHDGAAGPGDPVAKTALEHCHSCGFLLRISGPLAGQFGVCANGDANRDGQVVALMHGCGAHSETRLPKRDRPQPLPQPTFVTEPDDLELF